jgi:hypothetical protein
MLWFPEIEQGRALARLYGESNDHPHRVTPAAARAARLDSEPWQRRKHRPHRIVPGSFSAR